MPKHMRPTGHLHSSLLFLYVIYSIIPDINTMYGIVFIFGAIFVDIDILYSFIFDKTSNHRLFITHYPGFYIICLIIVYLLNVEILFWLIVGILVHLSFDWFDWGIPIIPFTKNKKWITAHLLEEPESLDEIYFFVTYWQNKIILSVEVVLFLGCYIVIWFLPAEIIVFSVITSTIFLGEIILNYKKFLLNINNKVTHSC